jgi:hypothetical protein
MLQFAHDSKYWAARKPGKQRTAQKRDLRALRRALTLSAIREDGNHMTEAAAEAVWIGLGAYLGFGLVIGLGVILFGLARLTPARVPVRVRLLILPGLAALWPVVLVRLAGLRTPEDRA